VGGRGGGALERCLPLLTLHVFLRTARPALAGRSGVDVLVSGGPGLAKPVSERAKTENRKQGPGARRPGPWAATGLPPGARRGVKSADEYKEPEWECAAARRGGVQDLRRTR